MSFPTNLKDDILIDIDCIYDIRLSILQFLFSDNTDMILDTDKYLERKRDVLKDFYKGAIPIDAQTSFDEELALKEVLYFRNGAMLTGVLDTTSVLIREEFYSKDAGGDAPVPTITVNFAGYSFTDEEKLMITNLVRQVVAVPIDVKHCSIDSSLLTPSYMRKYSRWITYNFDKWATEMVSLLRECPIPLTEVTAGFICHTLMYEDGTPVDFVKEAKAAATGMAPVAAINYIPLAEMSISTKVLGAKFRDKILDEMEKDNPSEP